MCPMSSPGLVLRRTAGGDKHACVHTDRFALKMSSLRPAPTTQLDEQVCNALRPTCADLHGKAAAEATWVMMSQHSASEQLLPAAPPP